jgi:hypothetical protein
MIELQSENAIKEFIGSYFYSNAEDHEGEQIQSSEYMNCFYILKAFCFLQDYHIAEIGKFSYLLKEESEE